MTLRRYMCRALLIQFLINLFSCGTVHAEVPAIPSGVSDAVNASATLIGLAVAVLVLQIAIFFLLLMLITQIHQIQRWMVEP